MALPRGYVCFIFYHLHVANPATQTVYYIEIGSDVGSGLASELNWRGLFCNGVPNKELETISDFEYKTHSSPH